MINKISMVLLTLLLTLSIFTVPSPIPASNKDYSLKTTIVSEHKIEVTFELKDYRIEEFTTRGKTYSRIGFNSTGVTVKSGKPQLPFIPIIFGMPVTGNFDIQVRNIQTEKKIIPHVYPVQSVPLGPIEESKFECDEAFYRKNTLYPEKLCIQKESGFLRDHRLGAVNLYPFRYNPVRRSLLILKKATIFIYLHESEYQKGIIKIPARNDPYETLFSNLVINYEKSKLWLKPHPLPKLPKLRQSGTLYKIVTDQEGIYQLTYSDMVNAGIDPSTIDPRKIHISHKGYEIPVYVKGEEDSVFNMQDYIDFFAVRTEGKSTYYNPYTDENIYWLHFGDSLGKRMVEEDGTPSDTSNTLLFSSFRDTVHFEKDSMFVRLSQYSADTTDAWFWDRLVGPDTETVNISIPSPDTSMNFGLSIMIHGVTTDTYGHKIRVLWNGTPLGEFNWTGQKPYKIELENLSGTLLKNGENNITFIVPQPAIDTIAPDSFIMHVDGSNLNWLEVNYQHLLDAVDNKITFRTEYEIDDTTYEFKIHNFDFADLEVYKNNVSKIINFEKETYQEGGKTKYRLIFQDDDITSLMDFTIIPKWEKLHPLRLEKVIPTDLHSTANRAEYLIITSDSLKNCAHTYGLWKESHGRNCMVVTTDEIYNQFNYGIASPEAIKQFITYAYNYYTEPPVYCLLFGDGTYDYKGITGHQGNIVPVHLSWVRSPNWGPAADDGYFASVSGNDYIPDIFIGRFPIRTDEEFDRIFGKIKVYADYQHLDEWRKDLVFVADSGTAGYYSYKDMENIIENYLPTSFDASRCYHPRKMREDFLKEMDEGAIFVNFLSHGGGDVLCGGGFVTSKDIYRMTNLDRPPFWTAFSCVNGYFAEPPPDSISIGETVFLAPNGGGIGYYGPSSLTWGGNNYVQSRMIYDAIFNQRLLDFGQFITYGEVQYYLSTGDKYQIITYNMLGDPGLELTLPDTTHIDLTLFPPSLSAGDTLTISGTVDGSPDGEVIITLYGLQDSLEIGYKKINTNVTSGNFSTSTIIPDTLPTGKGIVKVYFRGDGEDGIGYEYYNIEQPNISSVTVIPKKPTSDDSVQIRARIFDPDSVVLAMLMWKQKNSSNWNQIQMEQDTVDTFITSSPIPPQSPGKTVEFEIYATDSIGNSDTSRTYSYHITALAELSFSDYEIYLGGDTSVVINVDIQNRGETPADSFRVGFYTLNSPSKNSPGNSVRIPLRDTISYDTLSLGVDSVKTATADFHLPFDRYDIYAVIDPDNWVEEGNETNNSSINYSTRIWVDHFQVTPQSGTGGKVQSCDSVVYCLFDSNTVSSKTVLTIKPDTMIKPELEPDISPVPINGDTSGAYNISLSREVLLDSFLTIFNPKDSLVQVPWIYLWLNDYNKWTTIGKGELNDSSFYERNTKNTGLYTLFFNNDSIPPSITSRIENSGFKNGTVYEKNVRISSILTDKNGIDVVTRRIMLQLNGDSVEASKYSYSKNPADVRALPLKYSQDLEDGSYTLIVSTWDVNGNMGSDTISFNISIPFDISGIGNYPNPVYLDSTIFTYHLSRNADEVGLKIYTSGGRMIKSFARYNLPQGYHEIVWDLKDKEGEPVANGVYFYRFYARRGKEEKILTFKMAILR
jgi:hypothetical protein